MSIVCDLRQDQRGGETKGTDPGNIQTTICVNEPEFEMTDSDFQVFQYTMRKVRKESSKLKMTPPKLVATFDSLHDARRFAEGIETCTYIQYPQGTQPHAENS